MLKLDSNEKIILEVRKHWFIIFADGFVLFLVALSPLVLFTILFKLFPQINEIKLGGDNVYLLSFFYSVWLLGVWIAFFIRWTDYYLDVWYITPKRIISIDQRGLFHREVIDLRFEKIQDVTSEINGIIATVLDFGDIHVQTAGSSEEREVVLKRARDPLYVKKIILGLHSAAIEKDREGV